jgi:hypothetical protein
MAHVRAHYQEDARRVPRPDLYEEFEYLNRAMAEMDRKRGLAPYPRESMRQMMEDMAALDEEPPTTMR